MIYQLIVPTIPGKDVVLYQTPSAIEIQVIKERYESMKWEVQIKELKTNHRHCR